MQKIRLTHHQFTLKIQFIRQNQTYVEKVGHQYLLMCLREVVKPNSFIFMKNGKRILQYKFSRAFWLITLQLEV